ncbi:hypothetical protein J6I39_09575 [bacterium]|nr:hypothetical protein [bacterium]
MTHQTIKLLEKQSMITSEYDIITFNACVGTIDTYCGCYDNDPRSNSDNKVRRLIRPTKLEIISKAPGLDVA